MIWFRVFDVANTARSVLCVRKSGGSFRFLLVLFLHFAHDLQRWCATLASNWLKCNLDASNCLIELRISDARARSMCNKWKCARLLVGISSRCWKKFRSSGEQRHNRALNKYTSTDDCGSRIQSSTESKRNETKKMRYSNTRRRRKSRSSDMTIYDILCDIISTFTASERDGRTCPELNDEKRSENNKHSHRKNYTWILVTMRAKRKRFFFGFFVGAKSCTGRTKNDSRFRMQAASVKSIKLINCVNRKFK